MSSRATGALALGSLLGALVLGGCVPANPDAATYEQKTALTLGGALSEVATVQQLLETLRQDRMFRPTAIAQMRSSESNLDTNAGAYGEVHPPPQLDWLQQRTSTLLTESQDTVFQARLAIERHQADRYPAIAQDLSRLAEKLDKLQKRVQ